MRKLWCGRCALLLVLGATTLLQAQIREGYSLRGNRIFVDRPQHWEDWSFPSYLVRVDSDGSVRPRNFRGITDLLQDPTAFGRPVTVRQPTPRILNMDSTRALSPTGEFLRDNDGNFVYDYLVRPGVSRVGSNVDMANNIIDGDPNTYWEPDPNDPIEDWWVEVDVGRAAYLERLRFLFAEEGMGDPFYQFILYLGKRQTNHLADDPTRTYTVLNPFEHGGNVDQRVFVYEADRVSDELPEDGRADPDLILGGSPSDWTGTLLEVVRFQITGTRGTRAELVSREEWEALPPGERGDVIYWLHEGTFEEPVEPDVYATLAPERQGRIDHYRRELPRLSEVEAWGWGDEIGQAAHSGGGVVELTSPGNPGFLFDGDYNTDVQLRTLDRLIPGGNTLHVDLGSAVWLDRMVVIGLGGDTGGPRGFIVRGSTGARGLGDHFRWEQLNPDEWEDDRLSDEQAAIFDPPSQVRHLQMIALANADDRNEISSTYWPRIRAIMLFSEGPPAQTVLESPVIELPRLYNIGAVRWVADEPPGSEVTIRTRTGTELAEEIHYYDRNGVEKTEKEHNRLPRSLKGLIDTTIVAGPGWSPWSEEIEVSGGQAKSPGPRRFLMIQARLLSHDRQTVPSIESLDVELLAPVAQQLGAEVWPEVATAGILDTFEVYLQPQFLEQPVTDRSPGLDEVLLHGDPLFELYLVDAALGTESELARGRPQWLFERRAGGGIGSADGQTLRVISEGDSLWVGLPFSVRSAATELVGRSYYRRLEVGAQAPASLADRLLSVNGYLRLPEEERGAVRHYHRVDGALVEVDIEAYYELPEEERAPIRYYRIVTSLGQQTVFNARGDTLDRIAYNRLSADERGWIVGPGLLLRLRFAAVSYLQSTRLRLAVRESSAAPDWQTADGQDVTGLRPASTLVIATLPQADVLGDLTVAPNPFTPNGDGINDEAQIAFSLFKVAEPRPVVLRIFTLVGDTVRRLEQQLTGGPQSFAWDGRDDDGDLVPPGLYLCQIEASTDALDKRHRKTRVVGVVY